MEAILKALKASSLCALLVQSVQPAIAGDFYVQFNSAASAAEKEELKETAKAQRVKLVPSLGQGVEVWRAVVRVS
jgi:hypothetical protein